MSNFLADQSKLSDLTDKFAGKTPVRIHFLDNSSKIFLIGEATTVQDILLLCLEKYGVIGAFDKVTYFGLFESKNGGSIDGCLKMESPVVTVLNTWKELQIEKTAKFLFMIRLFLPSLWGIQYKDVIAHRLNKPKNLISMDLYLEESETTDVNCLHLQFIQAVYNVITGKYPTTQDEALELGAIHFLFKFNSFIPESHISGFLGNRIMEFIPIKLIKAGFDGNTKNSLQLWETKLLEKVQQISESNDVINIPENEETGEAKQLHFTKKGQTITSQRKYMDNVFKMANIFGVTMFRCSQRSVRSFPENLYLGIQHGGLGVFEKNKKLIRFFPIEDIFRWGFKPNQMFYFEISADNDLGTGSLEFDTAEGKTLSDLMTDYALAFLKERELEDYRFEEIKAGRYDVNNKNPNKPKPPPSGTDLAKFKPLFSQTPISSDQEALIVKFQALYRGHALRRDWQREDAAILLQSVFRGYLARIRLSKMIEQMIKAGEL